MNTRQIFEARTQVKRKYGEHASIRVNEKTPVRNKVIEFVGKRFVTETEMKAYLTQLSESRGKELNQKQWFERNQKFFESFENRGQKVWTLSKYGKRVHEMITKSAQKQMVSESIGLFKSHIFESAINEGVSINNLGGYSFPENGNFSIETPEEQEAIMKFLNVRSMDELYNFGGEVENDSERGGDEADGLNLYDDYNEGPDGEFNQFAFFELRRRMLGKRGDRLPDELETSGMGSIIEGAIKGVCYWGNDYGYEYIYTNKKTVLELLKQFNANN